MRLRWSKNEREREREREIFNLQFQLLHLLLLTSSLYLSLSLCLSLFLHPLSLHCADISISTFLPRKKRYDPDYLDSFVPCLFESFFWYHHGPFLVSLLCFLFSHLCLGLCPVSSPAAAAGTRSRARSRRSREASRNRVWSQNPAKHAGHGRDG